MHSINNSTYTFLSIFSKSTGGGKFRLVVYPLFMTFSEPYQLQHENLLSFIAQQQTQITQQQE